MSASLGLSIPCTQTGPDTWVLAFLLALGTRLARRIEVWLPDIHRTALHRVAGFCEVLGKLSPGDAERSIRRGASTIGQTMVTGIPAISHHACDEPGDLGASATAAGLQVLLARPLLRDGRLLAVIGWYFWPYPSSLAGVSPSAQTRRQPRCTTTIFRSLQ